MSRLRSTVLTALVGVSAGLAGALIGNQFTQHPKSPSVHELVHEELTLSPAQDAALDALEGRFAARRSALQGELKQANRELAAAIAAEKGYGPRVTAAVDHFHRVMGQLQKETLEHMFRMRAILDANQAKRFDQTVGKALTSENQ